MTTQTTKKSDSGIMVENLNKAYAIAGKRYAVSSACGGHKLVLVGDNGGVIDLSYGYVPRKQIDQIINTILNVLGHTHN